MSAAVHDPVPADPGLPEARILLTSEARPILETVLDRPVPDATISQISYRPGREIVVVFSVGTGSPVVLAAGRIPDGAAILDDGVHRIGAWVYPHDPALPGLPLLFDSDALGEILAPLGLPPGLRITTRSYRPRKRAVVEVSAPGHRVFVKAIRPAEVERLQANHTALAPHIRIPRSLGWSPEAGIVVLEAIPGMPLSSGPDPRPHPSEVLSILDDLPETDGEVTPRRRRVRSHLRLLRLVAPHRGADLDRIEEEAGEIRTGPPVPVHGDFHSGQLLVADGRLTGVVDVDTAGIGERADDVANLLAHLHVVALGDPTGATGRFGARVHALAATRLDDTDLRRRVAASIAGYAPGPWLRQLPRWRELVDTRIDAAVCWLPAATGASSMHGRLGPTR